MSYSSLRDKKRQKAKQEKNIFFDSCRINYSSIGTFTTMKRLGRKPINFLTEFKVDQNQY